MNTVQCKQIQIWSEAMQNRIVREGNAFYEIDEACLEKKRRTELIKEQKQKKKTENGSRIRK